MTRNYTLEETEKLKKAYLEAPSYDEQQKVIKQYAEIYCKPEASIRAKLVKEKVYKSAVRLSAITGGPATTKLEIIQRMEKITGLSLVGMEKASKLTLHKLLNYLEENEK